MWRSVADFYKEYGFNIFIISFSIDTKIIAFPIENNH